MENYSSFQNGQDDYQKLIQTITSSIQKISQNVSSMQRMINQIGTPQDSREIRKQLHSIQHYTQQLVKDTSVYIKDLNNVPPVSSSSDQRQRKMQKERLRDEFTAALNIFQMAQRSAAQKEREQVNKVKMQTYNDPFISIKRDQQLIELQDNSSKRNQQQLQLQEEQDLQALQEQEQAVRQLESDINDVNQIFKELGSMVHEQGEVVDSIEASVERAESFVSEGAQQLSQASIYKNKIRKKKVLLACIAAVILTVIIIIIIWKTN